MQRMQIDPSRAVPVDPAHFSGSVARQDLAEVDAPRGSALLVAFQPGARTHWHSHPNGQFLYVTDGDGRIATRDGEVAALHPGDLVYAPPGEVHWHGASADNSVAHMALSFGDTEWFEELDQQAYDDAAGDRQQPSEALPN